MTAIVFEESCATIQNLYCSLLDVWFEDLDLNLW